jgi:hypothetical protein
MLGIVLVAIGVIGIVAIGVIGIVAIGVLSQSTIVSMDRAIDIAQGYLASFSGSDLAIAEIMEFAQNFYVVYYEASTGIGAFEMLIDKTTGRIFPEYGPNMMWNLKYGHGGMMGGWTQAPSSQMPVNQSDARQRAQRYLDTAYPGTSADEVHPFYGYYTIHITRNGEIDGMLSVNGYDGDVWYHSWHGAYIQRQELHHSE